MYKKPRAPWARTEPPQELVELIEGRKISPCKTIDIECGEGFYSIYLASKGFDVTGIDISERAIQYAKGNAASRVVNVHFIVMDIADLERLNEKFDFVLEWALIHQIMPSQRRKYVEDVAELLDKGGNICRFVSMNKVLSLAVLEVIEKVLVGQNYISRHKTNLENYLSRIFI